MTLILGNLENTPHVVAMVRVPGTLATVSMVKEGGKSAGSLDTVACAL